MAFLEVRIVHLDPMHIASFLGYGPNPEALAWTALAQWTATNGLMDDPKSHRFFGFNNPNPSRDNPNYGYEQWVTIPEDFPLREGIQIKDFPGGLYAMTSCRLQDITGTWARLAEWCKDSRYRLASHQILEECLTPEFFIPSFVSNFEHALFDLFLPVAL